LYAYLIFGWIMRRWPLEVRILLISSITFSSSSLSFICSKKLLTKTISILPSDKVEILSALSCMVITSLLAYFFVSGFKSITYFFPHLILLINKQSPPPISITVSLSPTYFCITLAINIFHNFSLTIISFSEYLCL